MNEFLVLRRCAGASKKKQGRIHGNPVADGWAGAVLHKSVGIQKCDRRTDRRTDGPTKLKRGFWCPSRRQFYTVAFSFYCLVSPKPSFHFLSFVIHGGYSSIRLHAKQKAVQNYVFEFCQTSHLKVWYLHILLLCMFIIALCNKIEMVWNIWMYLQCGSR